MRLPARFVLRGRFALAMARSAQARAWFSRATTKKKAGQCPAFLVKREARRSDRLNVRSLLALRALRDFEADLLAFLERLEALHIDRREVSEQILTTAIGSDEAEALRVVEPLHSSGCHVLFNSLSTRSKRDVARPMFRSQGKYGGRTTAWRSYRACLYCLEQNTAGTIRQFSQKSDNFPAGGPFRVASKATPDAGFGVRARAGPEAR